MRILRTNHFTAFEPNLTGRLAARLLNPVDLVSPGNASGKDLCFGAFRKTCHLDYSGQCIGIGWLEAAGEMGEPSFPDSRMWSPRCMDQEFHLGERAKSDMRSRHADRANSCLDMDLASEVFRRHGTGV